MPIRHAVISQKSYAETRVDSVSLLQGQTDEDIATSEQKEENRAAIGNLSWLAKQTQHLPIPTYAEQPYSPTVADLKATNRVVKEAKAGQDETIILRSMPEENLAFFAYHAAAWGNVDTATEEADDGLWYGENKLASQLGQVILASTTELHGVKPRGSASSTGSPKPANGSAEALSPARPCRPARQWRTCCSCGPYSFL